MDNSTSVEFTLNTKEAAEELGKAPKTIYLYCTVGVLMEGEDWVWHGGERMFNKGAILEKRKTGFKLKP